MTRRAERETPPAGNRALVTAVAARATTDAGVRETWARRRARRVVTPSCTQDLSLVHARSVPRDVTVAPRRTRALRCDVTAQCHLIRNRSVSHARPWRIAPCCPRATLLMRHRHQGGVGAPRGGQTFICMTFVRLLCRRRCRPCRRAGTAHARALFPSCVLCYRLDRLYTLPWVKISHICIRDNAAQMQQLYVVKCMLL